MGSYATGELIWGIPVKSYDDEGNFPTPFWSEEDDYWRTFDSELEISSHGHYEGDGDIAILTSKRIESKIAFCGDAVELSEFDLNVPDKVMSKANDAARVYGLDVDFYTDARWWLVASYG